MRSQVLNIAMQVGQVTETVQVTEEAPQVELTSSAVGATLTATTAGGTAAQWSRLDPTGRSSAWRVGIT